MKRKGYVYEVCLEISLGFQYSELSQNNVGNNIVIEVMSCYLGYIIKIDNYAYG